MVTKVLLKGINCRKTMVNILLIMFKIKFSINLYWFIIYLDYVTKELEPDINKSNEGEYIIFYYNHLIYNLMNMFIFFFRIYYKRIWIWLI